MYPILQNCKITRCKNAVAAGTSDQDGTVLDMAGFDAVIFIAALGDVTVGSVLDLECQGSAASDGSNPTKETGIGTATAGATDHDNVLLVLDVIRPSARYVFPRVKRGTANAVIDSVIAIQYRTRTAPVTQDTTVKEKALQVVN